MSDGKPKRQPLNWGQRIEPFADIYRKARTEMFELVRNMPDDDLRKLKLSLKRPNTTNCRWYFYDALPMIEEVIAYRKRLKKDYKL